MFCRQYVINLKKIDEVIHLRPLGDIHIGNLGCDLEKFKKNITTIANRDDHFTLGMGDYIDNVMAFAQGGVDKRWNPETVNRATLTTEEQLDALIKYWEKLPTPSTDRAYFENKKKEKIPISHKTFGMMAGNHEWKTINQRRFIKDVCEPLKIKYLGRLAFVHLAFKYKHKKIRDYVLCVMHGGYSGMMAGGAVNRMKMISGDFDADVFLMGHSHDTWTRSGTKMSYDEKTNSPIEKKILFANTGTFLKGYVKGIDSYVEINPREAKRVGTITISFNPYKGEMFSHD